MPARDQRVLLLAAVATSALLMLAAAAGHPELPAYAAPLVLLVVPLIAKRLRRASWPRRSPVRARLAAGGRRTMLSVARGGRLIADALAERGPPRSVLSSAPGHRQLRRPGRVDARAEVPHWAGSRFTDAKHGVYR